MFVSSIRNKMYVFRRMPTVVLPVMSGSCCLRSILGGLVSLIESELRNTEHCVSISDLATRYL